APRIWHVSSWLASWARHWFARCFTWRRPSPTIRKRIGPGHRPVQMRVDILERREGPTGLMANDHLTASLMSFAALHERLPALTQSEASLISVSERAALQGGPSPVSSWVKASDVSVAPRTVSSVGGLAPPSTFLGRDGMTVNGAQGAET